MLRCTVESFWYRPGGLSIWTAYFSLAAKCSLLIFCSAMTLIRYRDPVRESVCLVRVRADFSIEVTRVRICDTWCSHFHLDAPQSVQSHSGVWRWQYQQFSQTLIRFVIKTFRNCDSWLDIEIQKSLSACTCTLFTTCCCCCSVFMKNIIFSAVCCQVLLTWMTT